MNEDFRSRFRINRRDYTGSTPADSPPSQSDTTKSQLPEPVQPAQIPLEPKQNQPLFNMSPDNPTQPKKPLRISARLKSPVIVIAVLTLVLIAGSVVYFTTKKDSPVPKTISQGLNLPVYYPDPKKLPAGYALDTESFKKPKSDTVVYSVSFDTGKSLVFSIQPLPPNSQLQSLISRTIPLHNSLNVKAGTATIGIIQNQTVVLLPTSKALIIMTGPVNLDQGQLKQVLNSIKT